MKASTKPRIASGGPRGTLPQATAGAVAQLAAAAVAGGAGGGGGASASPVALAEALMSSVARASSSTSSAAVASIFAREKSSIGNSSTIVHSPAAQVTGTEYATPLGRP